MTEIICEKCGSKEIEIKECFKRTNGPKNKKQTNKRMSYGAKIIKYTCSCGHTWEV